MVQETIDTVTLREMLDRGQPVTVLDIRPAEERAEWAIPGSVYVNAYDALKGNDPEALAGVDLPIDRPVVTVCGAGATSLIAAAQLRARGWQAWSLVSGMKAWSLAWNIAEAPLPDDSAQVVQVRRTGKGCLSYLIGSDDEAAVIDPALDPEVYLSLARQRGWRISHVLDTHVHADHLSRGRKLAEMSGAAFYLMATERVSFPVTAVHDGDVLPIGRAKLKVLNTSGHTPESASYLLNDQALFTGDTLFLAGVGRPDLEADPEEARQRAHVLYRSLQSVLALPPETLIFPGHTSEPIPFDGQTVVDSLAAVRERVQLLHVSEETFVESLLARIPPTPPNHHRIVQLNEAGRLPDGDPAELEAGANRCAIS
jgi:glyoxylase-like metal-dependent hydrolase (beta-lactamase superfamily II)